MEPVFFDDDEMDEFGRRLKVPERKKMERGKKTAKQLLCEVKIRMVMRIYGLSRAKSAKFIVDRERELRAEAAKKTKEKSAGAPPSVEDLFCSER